MKQLDYWKIGAMYKQAQTVTITGHRYYPYATTICAMRNLGIPLRDIAEFLCDELEICAEERISNRQLANYIWKWKSKGLLDELAIKAEEAKINMAKEGVVVRSMVEWEDL